MTVPVAVLVICVIPTTFELRCIMNLTELKAKLDDKVCIERIHRDILMHANLGNPTITFVHTDKVPNHQPSRINDLQLKQLTEDGYTVVATNMSIHSSKIYEVSGW